MASFQGTHATLKRFYNENAAWKLLRADNAPIILAFIKTLFAEDNEVSYSTARIALENAIAHFRELGIWDTETNANTYLNQWIRSGWLREMDDKLTKTNASETALRFCQNMDEKTSNTTASHLRIVQEAVRDLTIAVNPDVNERIQLLEQKKLEIQTQIDALSTGGHAELDDAQQRERILEIYQLASVLTGDFRLLEDEIRQLDKDLRVEIIEHGVTRGSLLNTLLAREDLLAKSDAGNAFNGFFQLLCDHDRTIEFREQLRNLLSLPVADYLSPTQQHFLTHLMRELNLESQRVFRIRGRTEDSLREYIESGAVQENRAIHLLLSQLEKTALELSAAGCDLRSETSIQLALGSAKISSPESMRLKPPEETMYHGAIEEQENSRSPSPEMLDILDAVQIQEVAERVFTLVQTYGPLTIAGMIQKTPIVLGLEELVAYIRIAKSVQATLLNDTELVEVCDKNGYLVQAKIPKYFISSDLFPTPLTSLTL